jgi:hypothetical protein
VSALNQISQNVDEKKEMIYFTFQYIGPPANGQALMSSPDTSEVSEIQESPPGQDPMIGESRATSRDEEEIRASPPPSPTIEIKVNKLT